MPTDIPSAGASSHVGLYRASATTRVDRAHCLRFGDRRRNSDNCSLPSSRHRGRFLPIDPQPLRPIASRTGAARHGLPCSHRPGPVTVRDAHQHLPSRLTPSRSCPPSPKKCRQSGERCNLVFVWRKRRSPNVVLVTVPALLPRADFFTSLSSAASARAARGLPKSIAPSI
jgi:hypothetical protein